MSAGPQPRPRRFAGKTAIVIGAASGIGAATARLLAAEGVRVVLADRNAAGAEDAAEAIRCEGGIARAQPLDVIDEESWIAAIAAVLSAFGRLDIAVNCAGTRVERTVPTETRIEDWRRLMAVNLDRVFFGTKHALRAMERGAPPGGSIVDIPSVMGLVGMAGIDAYNASKGGVLTYSKSVALSCAERGLAIRVNTVHPGFIDTPLLRQAMDAIPTPRRRGEPTMRCSRSDGSGAQRTSPGAFSLTRLGRGGLRDRRCAGDRRRLHRTLTGGTPA